MSRAIVGLVGLFAVTLGPSASGQVPSARARALLDEARFDEAVVAFDEVLDLRDGLEREDVLDALLGRATARLALRDEAAAANDVGLLLAIEPDVTLDRRHPPSLHRLVERARRTAPPPLALHAAARGVAGGVEIEVAHEGARELVRAVEIHHDGGTGRWQSARSGRIAVRADAPVRYFVVAVGPGGAWLATSGTQDDPRYVAPERAVVLELEPEADEAPRRRRWPVALGVIGGVLVAGAVVALVATRGGDDRTALGRPREVTE